MLKGIVFDFDGVIAESIQIKTDAFAEIYKPYGQRIVEKVVNHHQLNGGISRFDKFRLYHESFLGTNIGRDEISRLANRFTQLVIEKVIAAPYIPGILDFIDNSYKSHKLFISTGTPTLEIKEILKGRKIFQYFTAVFGSPDSKTEHLNCIMDKYNYKSTELIFFGDSYTDLEAAKNTDIKFVLVKNAYNNSIAKAFKGRMINNFINI